MENYGKTKEVLEQLLERERNTCSCCQGNSGFCDDCHTVDNIEALKQAITVFGNLQEQSEMAKELADMIKKGQQVTK